ncbi:MAG: agmatine deiminase family protein [Hyphomonadaceae bacterium]
MQRPHIPAEWAPHRAIWTAWPYRADQWAEGLAAPRAEIAAMAAALVEGERVHVLVRDEAVEADARRALSPEVELIRADYGDVWLRDIGPIFAGEGAAHGFRVNGWGGKYDMAGDASVAAFVAARAGAALQRHDFVLEGGAVDMDGEGSLLTTRQCMLNPNRNPGWTEADAEAALKGALGVRKVLWLDEGLTNDHTDGHIDNIARFVGPGRVVCQAPVRGDPNANALDAIARALEAMRDAHGRRLEVVRAPSPGEVRDDAGEIMPASHMNFIIGNAVVVAPVYNEMGEAAVDALAPLFPGRRVIGLSARALLVGGGAFHCITQQELA